MFTEIITIKKDELLIDGDIFCEVNEPLEKVIGELLRGMNLTLSTAESCTGGGIAARITSISGSSDYFKGSIVAYSNEVKQALLHVSTHTLSAFGAVSKQTILEMVEGVMDTLKTDCAVATSGIAGPSGGTKEKPVGVVWIAAACKSKVCIMRQENDYGREINIKRAVNNALLLLLELLK